MELVTSRKEEEEEEDLLEVFVASHRRRMQELGVERPLDFWIRSLSFNKPSLELEQLNSMGWPDRVLARHWEFGFKGQEMLNIFICLPPYLQQVTRRALHAVQIIMADKLARAARDFGSEKLLGNETAVELDLELDRAFHKQQSFGLIKQHLHPSTARRAHVFTSDTMCKLLGMHPEELLARLANRELSLAITEFDYLCYIMFSAWSFATRPGSSFEFSARLRAFDGARGTDCTMTKCVLQQEFDCYGRLKAIKGIFVPMDKADVELDVLDSGRMLVQKHLAAGRDYDTLMNMFESDLFAGETILGMQKSEDGIQRLRAVAEDLEMLFQPLVQHAEKILQEGMVQPS